MSEYNLEDMLQVLQEQMGEKLVLAHDRFFTFLQIDPGELLALSKTLREKYGFNYLANLTSVDYMDSFELSFRVSQKKQKM